MSIVIAVLNLLIAKHKYRLWRIHSLIHNFLIKHNPLIHTFAACQKVLDGS
jgi:hypothetical protein